MSDVRFVIKIDLPTPRLEVLRQLCLAIEQERYEARRSGYIDRPGSPGIVDLNIDLLRHVDRVYMPRIERLRRLIAEEKARDRTERRIAGIRRWP